MKLLKLLTLPVACAAALLLGTNADATTFTSIQHQASGYCVGNYNNVNQPGNPIVLWQCTPGEAQSWALVTYHNTPPVSDITELQNQNLRCITIPSGASNGTQVVIETCDGDAYQAWNEVAAGSYHEFKNPVTGFCLGTFNDINQNKNPIVVWSCNGGNAQQFQGP